MKRILFVTFAIMALVACQSNEKKAEALVKAELMKSLYKPDSYKPIETTIDSAFAPYDDPAFIEAILDLGKMNIEYQELEEKVKRAKSSMAIWSGPYQSAFGRNEYQEAKDEYDEANTKIEKLKRKGKKQFEKVSTMLADERKFVGYLVTHNYRADNNAGNTLIGNSVFFVDKDLKEVKLSMDVEEYNQLQEAIKSFKEQLEDITE
ncbi:MAG: hypothetical protein IKQ32_01215 [Prevotella sp.]|nr:hypothetical protein [Prevotella sp.]